jgi:hypothetical protein
MGPFSPLRRQSLAVLGANGIREENMQTRCVRVKLKPDRLNAVHEWQAEMNRRKEEALQTMREEGMIVETTFLERTSDGYFLIVLLIAEDFEKAKAIGRTSTHPIDVYHRNFRQDVSLEREDLDLLVDFNRIKEATGGYE